MKQLILTCEHGGNNIPQDFQALFKDNEDILKTHRGWDIGALEVAKLFSAALKTPLYYAITSRLLIELNRSLHHPHLFSTYSKNLPSKEKQYILDTFYYPYRNNVEQSIKEKIQRNEEVLHISIHSFTPVLNKVVRNTDFGLLYDPASKNEKTICEAWSNKIKDSSAYKVRLNYPYRGTADGFTTYLRKQFPLKYLGIELEINQQLLLKKAGITEVSDILIQALKESVL